MFRFHYSALVLLTAGLLSPGCETMQAARSAASETLSAFRPTNSDYSHPADDIGDPWIQAAGNEARGHRPREKENDPLGLRNFIMSPKARDIEHNLGFE